MINLIKLSGKSYGNMLITNPLMIKSVTSGFLSGLGDIIV